MSKLKCEATACHCEHLDKAEYTITLPNSEKENVSRCCAEMHIMAGCKSEKMEHKNTTIGG